MNASNSQDRSAAAELGDLTGVVAHEFNNILNNIMLQVAILEQKGVPESLRAEVGLIRQAGRNGAALVRHLQEHAYKARTQPQPLDLNAVVTESLGPDRSAVALPGGSVPLRVELADGLPHVLGNAADLGRLLNLLLHSAAAAVNPDPGGITLRTTLRNGQVLLQVSDTGPGVNADAVRHLFDPFYVARRGGDGVSLALCKALARRQDGTLHGDNLPEGGMVFDVLLRSVGGGGGVES